MKVFFFNARLFSFSVPASFRDKANPNFTIKRMYDSAREEFEQLERLREVSYVAAVKIILQAWHCSCVFGQ